MSYLTRSLRPAHRFLPSLARPTATSFHTSSIRNAMSENDRAKDHDGRDAKIDEHKHDSLSKQKSGQGHWKPELSSSSEQNVAADKDNQSIEQMQKEGAKKAEQGKEPSETKG